MCHAQRGESFQSFHSSCEESGVGVYRRRQRTPHGKVALSTWGVWPSVHRAEVSPRMCTAAVAQGPPSCHLLCRLA